MKKGQWRMLMTELLETHNEASAWLEFESGWLRRNLCGGKR